MVHQLHCHRFLVFLLLFDLSLITHQVSNANGKANATNLIKYSSMGCILLVLVLKGLEETYSLLWVDNITLILCTERKLEFYLFESGEENREFNNSLTLSYYKTWELGIWWDSPTRTLKFLIASSNIQKTPKEEVGFIYTNKYFNCEFLQHIVSFFRLKQFLKHI